MAYVNTLERQALAKERQVGEVKGEAKLLKKMIISKYGDCPEWVQEKLNEADSEQLGAWGQKIFQSSTLEGLLL
ncbi:hypothetical protein [Vreelandella jeotgali]|uniref:hypothetical protein n=1 Tax=Vreelandella jeotgali TaxID=553386 RepID=UPI00034B38F6|nr:hypothetical protein [Halomonas jeotgali]